MGLSAVHGEDESARGVSVAVRRVVPADDAVEVLDPRLEAEEVASFRENHAGADADAGLLSPFCCIRSFGSAGRSQTTNYRGRDGALDQPKLATATFRVFARLRRSCLIHSISWSVSARR